MFTVKDFLELPQVEWYELLGGEAGIEERSIEHVARVEAPVDNFVRPKELALSTILGLRDDQEKTELFIREVCQRQASALVISVPEDKITLLKSAVKFADKRRFPVILLPWDWHFSEIVDLVLGKIREKTLSTVSFFENIQKQMLGVYLANKDLDAAAELLADSFQRPVKIMDVDLRERGSSGRRSRPGKAGPTEKGDLIEIRTDSQLYGYLKLGLSEDVPDGGSYLTFVDRYINPILTLWFNKEWVIQVTRQNVKDDFVWKLAKGEMDPHQNTASQAELLGFDLNRSYCCLVGHISHLSFENKQSEAKWINDHINQIKEEALKAGKNLRQAVMLTFQQDVLIIFLEIKPDRARDSVNSYLDRLDERLKNVFPPLRFFWGIAEISTGPNNFPRQYTQAKLSQELGSRSKSPKNRYAYEDTVIFTILACLAENPQIKAYADNAVKPLLDYGPNGMELLETLKAYIQSPSTSEAARLLGIHRQSLLYRLEKIESLTGYSLKNHDALFFLELCLRLYLDFK